MSVLAVNDWFVKLFVRVNADIVTSPPMLAVLVILRALMFVAANPRKFASAVRVTVNVPLVVSGEPVTENSPGRDRPTLVTVPPPPVVAEIVPSLATMMVELSTFTRPSEEAVAALVEASVLVLRNAARPLAIER